MIQNIYNQLLTKLAAKLFQRLTLYIICVILSFTATAQPDPWKISASSINPATYYGITVANGMIGIVSSPEPSLTGKCLQ